MTRLEVRKQSYCVSLIKTSHFYSILLQVSFQNAYRFVLAVSYSHMATAMSRFLKQERDYSIASMAVVVDILTVCREKCQKNQRKNKFSCWFNK